MSLDVRLTVPGRLEAELTAEDRSVVALVGPNGAGKSTLLGALAGTVAAHGSARLDGEDLLRLPAHRRRVGLVFQDRRLFPHLSVLENVAFGPQAAGLSRSEARARGREWLERLGVADLGQRRAGELSGGQAQRVALARALVTAPRLLLLDEPFTGLAADTAAQLRDTLAEHLSSYDGITVVVTHDPRDVEALAERTIEVVGGRIPANPLRTNRSGGTDPRASR